MKTPRSHRKYPQVLAATLLAAMLASNAAHAANAAWNTDASSGDFNTPQWTSGVTVPAAGGTYTVLSGDALFFGTSSTTTLNNDLTSASYAGLTFNSGASAYTIGGNSFTLAGNVTNNSASTQTINNDITLNSSAARVFSATSGQLVFGGNITGANGLTLNATNKITLAGTNNVATATGGNNTYYALTVNAGAGGVDITGSTTVGPGAGGTSNNGYLVMGGTTTVTIQSGGSLTVNGSGTSNTTTPNSIIGHNVANGTSTLLVNGGTLTVGANSGFIIGNNRSDTTGVLTIDSGTATINRGSLSTTTTLTDTRMIMVGKDRATGTINLNGGTLATDRQFVRDGSTAAGTGTGTGIANFVFGGGTLKALGTQTDWLQSTTASSAGQNQGATGGTVNNAALALTSVTTTSANSTIDSNGFTVGINNAITGSGGFHIVDSSATTGIVNFGGASYAYTGATSVDSGTLNTNAASVSFAGAMSVAGGKLTLNGASAGTLALGANSFTMSLGTLSYSLGDQITGTGSFGITGGALDLTNSISDYGITYTLFNGFTSGSVSGLSIANYDTTNWVASLGTDGVLSFSAIPEPSTYAALAGVLALGAVITRRRNRQA